MHRYFGNSRANSFTRRVTIDHFFPLFLYFFFPSLISYSPLRMLPTATYRTFSNIDYRRNELLMILSFNNFEKYTFVKRSLRWPSEMSFYAPTIERLVGIIPARTTCSSEALSLALSRTRNLSRPFGISMAFDIC